jgi:hypothetical protein
MAMSEREERQAVEAWLARRKGVSEKPIGGLTERLQQDRPLGAVPVCKQHRWLEQADGRHLECLDCGLVVAPVAG